MAKELSVATCDILFKQRRVKVKDLIEGERFLTMLDGILYSGDATRCVDCEAVCLVNGGPVSTATSESQLIASNMRFAYSSKGRIKDEIGCYDEDGSGDAICNDCRAQREVA